MAQSDLYRYKNAIDYLANFPGARRETDRVVTRIHSGTIDVTDRSDRILGDVQVTDVPRIDTDLAVALASQGEDTLRVDPINTVTVDAAGTFPVEQQSPVAIENTAGDAVSPATEATVSSELSREIATWSAGAIPVDSNTPLDVSGAPVSVDSNTPLDVSAAPVSVDSNTPLDVSGATVSVDSASPLDVSGATVTVDVTGTVDTDPNADRADLDATVAASGSTTASTSALGAERLVGRVQASGTCDIDVEWKAADGSTVFSENVVSGATGGSPTEIDLKAISPDVDVIVTDTSAAENTVSGVLHLR